MATLRARKGDSIVVEGHRVGGGGRRGTILEVHGPAEHPHYRVRWEDGRESIFYPGGDALIVHVEPAPRTRTEAAAETEDEPEPVLVHEP